MKTLQHYGFLVPVALLSLILCSSTLTGSAQATSNNRKSEPPSADSKKQSYDLVYDLEIKEGMIVRGAPHGGKSDTASLANVIDAVRERYTEANIVMTPNLAHVMVSDLKLRTASIWEELEAIRVASGGQFEWLGPGSPVFGTPGAPSPSMYAAGPVDPATGLPSPNNKGLFTVREPMLTGETERMVEAFNIGPYLQIAGREEVEGDKGYTGSPIYKTESQEARVQRVQRNLKQLEEMILQTVSALRKDGEPPQFQFHSGANLLVVIGTREAVDVARKMVSALPGQPRAYSVPSVRPGETAPVPPSAYPGPDQDAFRKRYGLPAGQVPDAKK